MIDKCRHITKSIYNSFKTIDIYKNIGLFSGCSGILLYNVYYELIVLNNRILSEKNISILEHCIDYINSGNYYQYSICNGISGFGWLCEHLRELHLVEEEDIEFLDDLDLFLYRRMMYDIKNGNYDYLHGAIGIGEYLLCRFRKRHIQNYIKDFLFELEMVSIPSNNKSIKWLSILDYKTGEKGYNISLSHGMSSIVAFYSNCIH